MRHTGVVRRGPRGGKSKSAQPDAIVLETPKGTFRLRLPGGNPFRDTRLDELIGKRIDCDGDLVGGGDLMINNWKETG